MRRSLRRLLFPAVCLAALWAPGPFESAARACPMCKASVESDDHRPRAYMYSILFMLAMPATLATGFGIAFWRLSRQRPE